MSASKSYAEAAKPPPSTLKTPKQAAQGASSNNGGRSAVPAQLIPPPNTASHYPPVDSRVEKPEKNQRPKFAAGGKQHPGGRRRGEKQTGSQYEPGTGPPPNKKPTYTARTSTNSMKARDACAVLLGVPKKGGVENRDGNSPKTAKWRSAVEDARSTKPVRGNAKEETAEEEAEAQRAARAAEEEAEAQRAARAAEEEAEAQRAARAAEEEAEAQRAARAAEEEAEAERAARAAEEEAEAERKADEAEMAEMAEYGATMDFLAVQDVPSTGGRITETAPLKPPSELNPLSPFLNPLMWTTAEANAAAENGNGNTEAEMEIDDLILGKTLEEITAKYDALEKHTADAPACNSTDEAPGANAVHGSEVIVVRPGEVSTGGHVANTDADAPTIGLAAQMPDLNPSVQPPEVRTVEDYDRPASGFGNTGFSDTMASKPQMETDASGDRPASGFGNTGFSEDGNAYRGARGGGPIRHNRGGRSSSGAMSHRQPLPGNSVCPTETGFCNTGFTADELQSGAQAFGGSSSQQGTSRGGIGYPQRGGRGGGTGARLCRDRQQPWRIARACQGEPVCGSCYEEGHRTYECTNRGGSGNACYHCNARDHRAPDCPHRQEDDGPGFDENSKCSAPNDANWPYYVIQHGGGHYLAIFDFEKAATKKSGLGHLAENDLPPLVIRIRQDHVVKSSLHPPANMTKPCLTIGTRLHMRKVYRFTRMPEQIIGPTIKAHRLPDFLDPRTKLVNPSGHARMYALTQGPRSWSLPAIVVAIGKTDKRPRVSVRHSKKAVVLPEYSLHLVRGGADGDFTFTEGDVVLVWLTVPPRDGYMHPDSTYMLPAHHPMIDHERERTVLDMEREVFIWQTEPWPADKKLNMSDFFGDKSPATSGFVSESARMYDYGNLLYAANARAHELVQLRRAKGDYRGKLTPIPCEKNNRARVSMVFDEKEQATFVAKTQWWTDHAVFDVHVTSSSHAKKVKAKAAQAAAASQDATTEACEPAAQATTSEAAPVITVASGVPPEKDDANFSHYRCVGVAAIDWVRIDHKGRKIEAGLTFESDVPGEIEIPVKSPLHKVISGRSTTWLRPNDTNTGFKFDFDQLSGGRLSVAYNGSYPCMRPIAAFLRLEKQFDVPGTPRIDDEHPLREPAGKPRKRTAKGHGLHKQKEAADDEQLMDHSGGADADGEANAENMDVAEHTDGTEQQVVSVDECARMEHSDSKAAERGHEQQATVDHVVSGEPLLVFIPAPAGSGITYRSMEHNGSKAQERAREIRDLLERLRNWTPPRPLNDEQQETVDYIVDGEPLVFMSAPPGSGKTYVAAVLAAMLFISWRIVELEEELRLLEAPSEVPAVSVAVTTEHDHPREGDNYVAPEEAR
ncbi:hypothetical protein AAVH_18187 [Aphelenchoides avenae]|nr:hypothetical protein AAVH_18187 [Aphelenchus avenae]